ncbi:uncharacterized protein LOC106868331 [Octopus bimaculoides]|uniref:KY-like immunoglobulin-like domain-containing protein n=1 Tax=Octopus bimaculoides TaxID=37653 RepID=A0A0L8HVI9_OCTBM|nr:uncharacterized protein LOC106868331 [Octopus bimaculoides]|eukprot:XP_014769019.1 PREDICTED: uncharacterized protein LOC106868331 [Octopus bimaculoides]
MADQIPRPKISDGYLGMQAKFNEIGLSTLSHEDPLLELNGNAIEIIIGYNQPTRFTTKLLLCNSGGQDNPNFVMVNNLQGRMCYTITVPQIGYYKFQIYALPTCEAGPNMVNVFNYVLFFKEITDEFRPFPKQYPPWKNGCYMWEPRGIPHGCRAPGVPFKVHLPNAQQVMVTAGGEWTELQKVEDCVFQGLVDLSRQEMAGGGKVHLNVKGKGQTQYTTYLEYDV